MDVKWFNRLKPSDNESTNSYYNKSLLDVHTIDSLDGKVVLRQVAERLGRNGKEKTKIMRYTVMKDHIRVWQLLQSFKEEERTFHEVVVEGSLQKPRCDIDIDGETYRRCVGRYPSDREELFTFGDEAFSCIVKCFIKVIRDLECEIDLNTDVIVLDSGRETKYSRHVVFDKLVHKNHVEAKHLYTIVSNILNVKYLPCLDPAVYGSNQCLRILGSVKEGTTTPLSFLDAFYIDNELVIHKYPVELLNSNHKMIIQLSSSLLTTCIDCKYIHKLAVEVVPRKVFDSIYLNEESANEAFLLLEDCKSYSIDSIEGRMIKLRRNTPSMCILCCRVHDQSSPYLIVSERGNVQFHCRRDTSTSVSLGSIHIDEYESVKEDDSTLSVLNQEVQVVVKERVLNKTNRLSSLVSNTEIKLPPTKHKKLKVIKRETFNDKLYSLIGSAHSSDYLDSLY